MTQINADVRDAETYAIIGAAMEVHGQLGCGFLESVYKEALAIELAARNIGFRREALFPIRYRGQLLQSTYRADLICFEKIIVELKALTRLTTIDEAQCINYLKASGHERCLLLNFGASRLEYRRLVLTSSFLRPSAQSADDQTDPRLDTA